SDGTTLLSLARHWSDVTLSWNASDSTPCSWVGVKCNKHQLVVALNLSHYQISGQLGPERAQLRHLTLIDFSHNNFTGSIPSEVGNCSLLQHLDLSGNTFSGALPKALGNLLGNCSSLTTLSAVHCGLAYPIPPSLSLLNELTLLYIFENRLSGKIPPDLGKCNSLLDLQLNSMTGSITSSLGNLSSITSINLAMNGLTGLIPPELGHLVHLEALELSHNDLEGEDIPSSIGAVGAVQNLKALNLCGKGLTGHFPSELGNLVMLERTCAPRPQGFSKLEVAMMALGSLLFVFLVVLGLGFVYIWLRRPRQEVEISADEGAFTKLIIKIMEATDNLDGRYIIGRGAHGTVYKASIPDKVHAVKKLAFETTANFGVECPLQDSTWNCTKIGISPL
ncbi:Receptor-like protein kinase, partial [Actinidia chinensis var. chinensis]